ncbi:MAG: methyltransferase domain-containing protein [Deltaproteobacteria bacterium]|nr:methyltransferase domain-containing protein [Deltaproteobacteria bacterium]MBI3295219.1 methyltransferase domain-containing protein [Deltaproteobacteria bacterium]
MATTLTLENREYIPKAWEEVPCPFCGSHSRRNHEKYGPKLRFTYVQCRGCALVYGSPRPKYDEEFITAAYSVYDTESHHLQTRGNLNVDEQRLVEKHKITVRQIGSHLGRIGRLLEVGCATGLFLLAARDAGWEVEGIDISPSMVAAAQEFFKLRARCGQYQDVNTTEGGRFDAIYCSHVIEHIPNPNEWMEKFRRDLKPNGVLCLNVPNQFSLDRRLKRGLKRLNLSRDNWALWRTPDHLYEPHLKPMKYLLAKHGFELFEAFTYSSREKEQEGLAEQVFHHRFKLGSKLRLFARPIAN